MTVWTDTTSHAQLTLAAVWLTRMLEARRRACDPAVSEAERNLQLGLAAAWASAVKELECLLVEG